MVFVWVVLAVFVIGVILGILSLLGFGIHGDARERRFGLQRRREARQGPGRTTSI